MGELQSALAVGLEIMLQGMNVFTLDDLAAALRVAEVMQWQLPPCGVRSRASTFASSSYDGHCRRGSA